MKKRLIRLTEEDIRNIVTEATTKIVNERLYDTPAYINHDDIDTLNKIANTIREIMARTNYDNTQYLFDAYNNIRHFIVEVLGLDKR